MSGVIAELRPDLATRSLSVPALEALPVSTAGSLHAEAAGSLPALIP